MRLLINGANGMLGSEFVRLARERAHDVRTLSRADCDITMPGDVARVVDLVRPEAVIHCAAHTDVDDCERHPETAEQINTRAPGYFAEAARRVDACLVYVGSCGVFDGRKAEPYTEDDAPAPVTHYARSKLAGEQCVAAAGGEHLILRAGWLFGGDAALRKNFVAARWRDAQVKLVLPSATDKRGSPTWTRDFANKTLELLAARARGLFHLGNSGAASRFDYVSEIISAFGLPSTVEAVSSAHFARPAPVPDNEAIVSVRLPRVGVAPMRPWREALREYVAELRPQLSPVP